MAMYTIIILRTYKLKYGYNGTIFEYVLYKLNDIDLAITYCNSAIKNNETNVIAIGIRRKPYYLSNLFEEALEDFHKVLEIFLNKTILRCRGEYNEALADFNKLLEIELGNELALGKRGEPYFMIGNIMKRLQI
ncbi:hypothetical protein C2G38_2256768 [Gigaspora rosea]|uniref:Uncharacterized protein n=1 Tax=Gigaspora rosea TaxID=44941 RepID=A0A397TQ33_9GLOM|nr:hypothetical protein C2G38_2256768 [Gigaspora rosea]